MQKNYLLSKSKLKFRKWKKWFSNNNILRIGIKGDEDVKVMISLCLFIFYRNKIE